MISLQEMLVAKLTGAEQLVAEIRTLPQVSEEGRYAVCRWAIVGDETQKLMIQVEEHGSSAPLARLKAEINGTEAGKIDLWATYRQGEWRFPKCGAPGPGDEPPPMVLIRDLLQ